MPSPLVARQNTGILGNFGPGGDGGFLDNFRQSGFGGFLGNNSDSLLGLGSALLNNYSNPVKNPLGDIGPSVMLGAKADRERRYQNETVNWLMREHGLSKDNALAASHNPVILSSFLAPKLTEVSKGGSLYNNQTGAWTTPPGGDTADLTTDQKNLAQTNHDRASAGLPPLSLQDYQLSLRRAGSGGERLPTGWQYSDANNPHAGIEPMAHGPGTQVPGEIAARVGLADSFLGQAPDLRKDIAGGAVTGLSDRAKAGWYDASKQANIMRKMRSGTDALQRMLTGAGMPNSEAEAYANRYLPSYTDNAASAASKLDQLVRELNRIKGIVMRGRGAVDESADPNGGIIQLPSGGSLSEDSDGSYNWDPGQ